MGKHTQAHPGRGKKSPQRGAPALREQMLSLIKDRRVEATFQPIVDLRSGEVAGYETLSRPAKSGGFADAGALFDAAEKLGMQWELEEVTRDAALRAVSGWPAGTQLFMNISPRVFADPRFAAAILRGVRQTEGLTPSRLVLEITERSDQQYIEGLIEQVALVKSYGFQVAIDDVGAGTSGLNRIMSLRPRWLKLDRDLIENIHLDRARQNLIRFFLHFARLSGVRLVAEGIEHENELLTLCELQVPYGQGYYLGRPDTASRPLCGQVAKWFHDRSLLREAGLGQDPRQTRIARYARPTTTVESRRPICEIAGELLRQQSCPGVVVVEGGRYVGWCDREQILHAAGDSRATHPVAFLVNPEAITASPDSTVPEALEIAASRGERTIGSPLILTQGETIVGMLMLGDLLHAAAETSKHVQHRTAPLTGLPGRVQADEHVHALIARCRGSAGTPYRPTDAAMIDIRCLSDFNGAYGYDLGDQILKRLADMLARDVIKGESEMFLAHLGSDRFLVTGRGELLEPRLRRLAREFEHAAVELTPAESNQERGGDLRAWIDHRSLRLSLRIVLVRNVFPTIESQREFFRLFEQLREPSRQETAGPAGEGAGLFIVHEEARRARRHSA